MNKLYNNLLFIRSNITVILIFAPLKGLPSWGKQYYSFLSHLKLQNYII